jgi:hypothetical protein
MSREETEKKFGKLLLGKIVHYTSGKSSGKLHLYQITKTYRNSFGIVIWVDLHALEIDVFSHYTEHISVEIGLVKKLNEELISNLEAESKLEE